MELVRPVQIISPIGNPVQPSLRETKQGNKIYVEAHWIDPQSGAFLKKGLVKILDAETREDITKDNI